MTSVRPQLRRLRGARARKRLARAVRRHARAEYTRRIDAGVVEVAALQARTDLYEELARQLEAIDRPVSTEGTTRVRLLVAQPPPLFDYGPYARARDAELESILLDLAAEARPR